jgi:hypothetical protein
MMLSHARMPAACPIKGGSAALHRTALPAPRSGLRPRARARKSSYGTAVLGSVFLALDCPAPGRHGFRGCEDDGRE